MPSANRKSQRTRQSNGLAMLRGAGKRRRVAWVSFILVVVTLLCAYLDSSSITGFAYFEQLASQWKFAVKSLQQQKDPAKRDVELVVISDRTFPEMNLAGPPVPRHYHAKVIRELQQAGAKVIAFDLVFDLSTPFDPEVVAAVRDAQKKGVKVLWTCLFSNEGTPQQSLITPNADFLAASPYIGHINLPQAVDKPVIDQLLLAMPDGPGGKPIPAFSLEAARLALGLENEPLQRVRGGWQLGEHFIPADSRNNFNINFQGKPVIVPDESVAELSETTQAETFIPLAYQWVALGDLQTRFFKRHRELVKGKIVIVGDSTKVGNDHRYTLMGEMWGPEIHAQAIETLLQGMRSGRFLSLAPTWFNLLVIALVTALVCWLTATMKIGPAALAALGILVGFVLLNFGLFVTREFSIHLMAPCTAIVLAALLVLTERGLGEEREKNRVFGLLQRYVSPQVADYIVANPEKCFLGGERVRATVLFSDIRGFTSMSEKMAPEQVVERLNEYLQAMTEVVFRYDGTLDKYIGDAIMAIFGAPVPYDDHARRAVQVALDMQTALLELQERWQQQGLPVIDMGVGINTGEMVVGNMGSEQRTDFSVIGDCVNLASRVESLNKEMGSRILVTASTYESVRGEVVARGPMMATVKGKEEPCVVYEISGWLKDVKKTD